MVQHANEKIDPLTRIQEEIKEVVRREQEYRQLTSVVATPTPPSPTTTPTTETQTLVAFDDDVNNGIHVNVLQHDEPDALNDNNNNNNNNDKHAIDEHEHDDDDNNNNNSKNTVGLVNARPVAIQANTNNTLLTVPDEHNSPSSTPSLASSVNSKDDSLEEHHSDDSGISASSINRVGNKKSTVAGVAQATPLKLNTNIVTLQQQQQQQRYIGPNCYNMTPEPPQQKMNLTRTISTPHLNGVNAKPRQFVAFNASTKGVMQRFIASRGKLQMGNAGGGGNIGTPNGLKLNARSTMSFLDAGLGSAAGTPTLSNVGGTTTVNPGIIPTTTMTPAVIERDSEGRPLRPGYVPVELKIQRELKDLKSRETELKKIRKIRQSTPDLLDSIDKETDDENESDSEVEHCYGPGKLRSAKSIGELCDTNGNNNNNSNSLSSTPSPELLDHSKYGLRVMAQNGGNVGNGSLMRPAMSLAQLCDLDPEEAPSSHRLIAQWESLIQQNA